MNLKEAVLSQDISTITEMDEASRLNANYKKNNESLIYILITSNLNQTHDHFDLYYLHTLLN